MRSLASSTGRLESSFGQRRTDLISWKRQRVAKRWELNYEIVWTDSSAEGVAWVREEFEALWRHPDAKDLAEAVIQDIARVAKRVAVPDIPGWKTRANGDPGSAAIELPVYRRENGLWAHQKTFVEQAFREHRPGGARLLLADQVGLGKTIQLALAAKLMILWSGGNVLVVAPKPLLGQWQDEIWNLLHLPSAVWTGRAWIDERGVEHPAMGIEGLRACPRKVGIVSAGLIIQSEEVAALLATAGTNASSLMKRTRHAAGISGRHGGMSRLIRTTCCAS